MGEETTRQLQRSRSSPVGEIEHGAKSIGEHLAWVLGLAALLFACARVLVASGGNTETLKSLMQDLNITALVGATLLPFASTLLMWCLIARVLFVISRSSKERGTPFIAEVLLTGALTILLIWFTMPLGYLIANVSGFVLITVMGILGAWFDKGPGLIRRLSGLAGTVIAAGVLASLIVALFAVPGIWLPKEDVTIAGQPARVYVLSIDDRWTKVMDEKKDIRIIPSESVTRRNVVDESKIWYHQTLNSRFLE